MRRAWLLLCGALLAGCAKAPVRTATDAGIPAAYPISPQAAGTAAADIAWRDMFGDPRLEALIALALDNNRDLRVAGARIAETAALRRIARADRFPTLDLSASAQGGDGGRARQGGTTQQPGSGDPGQGTNPDTGNGGGRSNGSYYQVEIGVSAFELDFWGRVRNLESAALAEYLATIEARDAFRLSLIADLADTYLLQRELDERAAIAREALAVRERGLQIAQRRRDEGEGSDLELEEKRVLVGEARALLADLANQQAAAGNLLQLLVGAPLPADLPPSQALDAQGLVEDVAPGLPSELLLRRPDIREAEQGLRAGEANVAAARAALLPRITLTGGLGLASPELETLVTPGAAFWNVAGDLLQTIFDAGRRRAQVDADRARLQIAAATYERSVQSAFREVADALAARRFLTEQISARRTAYEAQNRRLALAQRRFEEGEAAFVDILTARRDALTAQQSLVSLRRAYLANAVTLYVALGGGVR